MPEYVITSHFSNCGTRNEVRMRVVESFAAEPPGQDSGDLASRYTYFVESLTDGNRVYLRRPANLHNGFDFVVCVENCLFNAPGERRRNYPKHEDIINDLVVKRTNEPQKYEELFQLMEKIYSCSNIPDAELAALTFQEGGFSADMIIKTLKWLFIEQDIRYWNYSGRDMLWNSLPRP